MYRRMVRIRLMSMGFPLFLPGSLFHNNSFTLVSPGH